MMAGMDTAENGWFHEGDADYDLEKANKEWPCFGTAISADPAHAYATLLQGKIVDTYSDEQIEKSFQKPVLLDAQALEMLEKRGFGDRTGVRIAGKQMGLTETITDAPINQGFGGATRLGIYYPAYRLEPIRDGVEVLATAAISGETAGTPV